MLFLFDYDGVIVDSFDVLLTLCRQAQRELGLGRPPGPPDFRAIPNLTFDEVGRRIGLPERLAPDYANRVFALQESAAAAPLFPGVAEVLTRLAGGHTLAVVTASRGSAVKAALEGFGLGGVMAAVLGGEDGAGKADRISALRSEFGFAPEDTFMIGDAGSDIRAGRRAGVRTAAVTWGFQDRERLRKERPEVLVETPEELLNLEEKVS